MKTPLVITVAGTGAELTRKQSLFVPLTLLQIAEQAQACQKAGASLWHLHVRDVAGKSTCDPKIIRQTMSVLRKSTQMIVQVSTGGAVGDSEKERLGTLISGLDMASLTLGSINFGDGVFLNPAPLIQKLLAKMRSKKIRPEFEIFDAGMMDFADYLIRKGFAEAPFHYNFVLGGRGFLAATEANLDFLISKLPKGAQFCAAGIGKAQFSLAEMAIARGGHVRVGMEDGLYLRSGELAQSNAELVRDVVALAKKQGRPISSPVQARRILQLPIWQGRASI
jgi:3-keto-5-aminohexanoate cleavage enzyme